MAKMDYNAINFRNKDVDKFSTKFGKTNGDPEKSSSTKPDRTAGMTEGEKNLYNLKGELGQKIFAKKIAKENVREEAKKNSTTSTTAPDTTKPEKKVLTAEQREIKKMNRAERFQKGVTTLATAGATALGAVGLYNQSKKKQD